MASTQILDLEHGDLRCPICGKEGLTPRGLALHRVSPSKRRVASAITRRLTRWARRRNSVDGVRASRRELRTSSTRGWLTTWSFMAAGG
jgi:hypothetical protein